jgi:ribose transport system permease protein
MSPDVWTGTPAPAGRTVRIPPPDSRGRPSALRNYVASYAVLLTFVAIFVFFSFARPAVFPTWDNAVSILNASTVTVLIAAGLTPALVVNDFDLSVASMTSLGSALIVVLTAQLAVSTPLAILLVLLVALAVGCVNGLLVVAHLGSSFIVTLAVGSVLTGIEFLLTDQKTIFTGIPQSLTDIGSIGIFDVVLPLMVAVLLAAGLSTAVATTTFGRQVYAVGSNAKAARVIGIPVARVKVACMCLSALPAALAGIFISATTGNSYPSAGAPYLLPAFAAAFLGSTLFASRRFSPMGSALAAIMLQAVATGLVEMNYASWTVNAFNGLVLILAVTAAKTRRA